MSYTRDTFILIFDLRIPLEITSEEFIDNISQMIDFEAFVAVPVIPSKHFT